MKKDVIVSYLLNAIALTIILFFKYGLNTIDNFIFYIYVIVSIAFILFHFNYLIKFSYEFKNEYNLVKIFNFIFFIIEFIILLVILFFLLLLLLSIFEKNPNGNGYFTG